MSEDIVVECDLADPPEKVWRALTEPALRDAWLGEPDVACEVVEARPQESVRYSWRDGGGVDSEVSFEITPADDGGTHLRLVHSVVTIPVMMAYPPRLRTTSVTARRPVIEMRLKWAA